MDSNKIIAKKKVVTIIENTKLSDDVFSMWIEDDEIASLVKAGQFVSLFCNDPTYMLPRPISVCEVSDDKKKIRLVYKVLGKGTKEFSLLKENDTIAIMGPLGNGFILENKKTILIGGGVGIPPLLELARNLDSEIVVVLGYRDNQTFLADDFKKYGKVYIATEDGSVGNKGNVIDAIKNNNISGDIIYSCGPSPMLRAVKEYGKSNNIPTQISLEERMACGVGACIGCVCKTNEVDKHSNVKNKRVCKDGPVFWAEEVSL